MSGFPKRDPDRFFGTIIGALLIGAGCFYAGRATAPVRTHVKYMPAPAALQQNIAAPPDAVAHDPTLPSDSDSPVDPAARVPAPVPTSPVPVSAAPAPGVQVWVNTNTGVYHMPGSRYYGNTSEGKYMGESDAIAAGYRRSERG